MSGKQKEIQLEDLLGVLKRKEVTDKVQNYSDYVENELKGESFVNYTLENDPDLEERDKDELNDALMEAMSKAISERDSELFEDQSILETIDPEYLFETEGELVNKIMDML